MPQLLGDHDLVLGRLVEFRSDRVAELVGGRGWPKAAEYLPTIFSMAFVVIRRHSWWYLVKKKALLVAGAL